MLKKDVKIGGVYVAKVSNKLTQVRIDSADESARDGRTKWWATNLRTGRAIRIHSAAKLRREVAEAKAS